MPISKNELRLGNHMLGAVIYELHTDFAILRTPSQMRPQYPYDDLIPLPVTEEYLIEAGFTTFDLSWQETGYHVTGLVLAKDGDAYRMVKQKDRLSRAISTINHLENLYYSLTGYELPYFHEEQNNIATNGFRIGNRVEQGKILELYSTHALIQLYIGSIERIAYGSLKSIPIRTEDLPGMGFIQNGSKWERGNFYLLAEHDRFFLRTDIDMYVTKAPNWTDNWTDDKNTHQKGELRRGFDRHRARVKAN